MDKSHKHRKGFRQDAELLGEAYESVHNNSQQINEIAPLVAAGLGYLGGSAVKGAVKGIYKGVTDPATPRGSEEINVSTSDQVEDEELSDDWMERDWKSREEEGGGDHAKGVEDAMDALEQIGIEIQEDIPGEDGSLEQQRNLAPLVKAHNNLSIALIKLVGEHGRNWVMGGQADAVAQSQLDFKPADGREW